MKFSHLSMKEKLLLAGSFLLLGAVRLTILVIPFRYIVPVIGKKMAESAQTMDRRTYRKAAKIGWAIDTMSRYTPWESKCLVQAVTALLFLRIFGIPYTLYLGLDRDEANQLVAHAWLRCGELIVTGNAGKERFRVVSQFARNQ
ncbi:lasso peptide biosynthesis B2 protein [Syntrophobotulus glycolicus]|nr:lasso peptide biosynthesis B2 protein [Syntrophobotulus glycolicus]